MRALILFDGSLTNRLCLEAAYQDARNTLTTTSTQPLAVRAQPTEALLVSIERPQAGEMAFGNPRTSGQPQLRRVLEAGVRRLETLGVFDKVTGEIIVCPLENLTGVLQDRAKEWKATAIYISIDQDRDKKTPVTPITSQPAKGWQNWRTWLGFDHPKPALPQTALAVPGVSLNTTRVNVKQLLEQSRCRVVLIDAEGIATKLSYYPPASQTAFRRKVERETLAS